jgi:hypothetical protein
MALNNGRNGGVVYVMLMVTIAVAAIVMVTLSQLAPSVYVSAHVYIYGGIQGACPDDPGVACNEPSIVSQSPLNQSQSQTAPPYGPVNQTRFPPLTPICTTIDGVIVCTTLKNQTIPSPPPVRNQTG